MDSHSFFWTFIDLDLALIQPRRDRVNWPAISSCAPRRRLEDFCLMLFLDRTQSRSCCPLTLNTSGCFLWSHLPLQEQPCCVWSSHDNHLFCNLQSNISQLTLLAGTTKWYILYFGTTIKHKTDTKDQQKYGILRKKLHIPNLEFRVRLSRFPPA